MYGLMELITSIKIPITIGFPGSLVGKNLPVNAELWARSLGQKDPLEEEMATHSSTLA